MVTITLSAVGAKNAANRLREFLATDGINLKQTHAYEALAQTLGYANWNTLQAVLNATSAPEKVSGDNLATLTDEALLSERPRNSTIGIAAERLAEQAAPRTAIPFDPKKFDKFVGYYQLRRDEFFTITRDGNRFLFHVTGQAPAEGYPESETKFFFTHVSAQVSFNLDAKNRAVGLINHHYGREVLAKRVDESVVKTFEDELQKYVANGKPTVQREVLLRRKIEAEYAGTPNLEDMAPGLIEAQKQQWQAIRTAALRLGKLQSLKFLHVKRNGWDVYNAVFENGDGMYEVGPLTSDNKLEYVLCYV